MKKSTYKTTQKTWDNFSKNIVTNKRDVKYDVPKEVLQRNFIKNEFDKIVD
jgi:uncharacterized sporulation protein YeaH/YhbH (DUF444 family)